MFEIVLVILLVVLLLGRPISWTPAEPVGFVLTILLVVLLLVLLLSLIGSIHPLVLR